MPDDTSAARAAKILIVEDDQGVRESLVMLLELQGHDVRSAVTGEDGIDLSEAERPDLLILDLNLPGIDGMQVCRRLRERDDSPPVLMLTARHEMHDRVAGLDAGADDYLPKPFALDELLARVRALLRRFGPKEIDQSLALRQGDICLDLGSRQVHRADTFIDLTRYEFDLLATLMAQPDVVVTRGQLHERVWGTETEHESNSLEVFISTLRKKLEHAGGPRVVQTVRGIGYVLRKPKP